MTVYAYIIVIILVHLQFLEFTNNNHESNAVTNI